MTEVVVTGAAGYLGAHVASLLSQRGVDCVKVGRSGAVDAQCDLLDAQATAALVSRFARAVFIHCAANVPSSSKGYSDGAAAEDSLAMVRNLVAARPSRVIFLSSMTVYPTGVRRAREEDALVPTTGYAWGKFAAERLLLDELPGRVTVLRIPGLFGFPRRSGLLFNVAKNFAEGRSPELPATPPQWATVHVGDAAEICVRAALRPATAASILNAGYPGTMSIADAVQRLARIFGCTVTAPPAISFSYDLTRLEAELGPMQGNYQSRLEELAKWVQTEVGSQDD